MSTIELSDLTRILAECAGQDEGVDLGGDIADTPWEDLGYDSLALMETMSRIEREYRVSVPEERMESLRTPADMLVAVNALLASV